MKLYVGRLPLDVSIEEVRDFFDENLNRGLLGSRNGKKVLVQDCEINIASEEARDEAHKGGLYSYAVVYLSSKERDAQLLKKLRGLRFRGFPVAVRPYVDRKEKKYGKKAAPMNRRTSKSVLWE